ncbi:unnamed protein product [Rotaria magnacalcarata]|uniref:BTB domain-containing protein n=1 Tax=Rotaria magnacalcarata TaxID=392030 RepID=A0A815DHQ3_9BILA|nr:unnamed protein product [Rotaria magnacalcarata]CAF1614246.1 unnamed protein product [Rotaria magnacalcarata]CAF2046543.1 unnamed protein product [Rotaria magnacalcarata]CAF2056358.1 unnamed protein product [Rotaria magnacalcarata]CAF3764231.1 unnamed protein product [Rotaria magnacalcarata]
MPKANSSLSYTSAHPPIPLPDHHNHPVTRRSSTVLSEASSLPPPANALSSNTHIEHENDDYQNKQIISLPFNWQASKFSLNDRISALCLNEYMADVHFELNDSDELIPAHKFVLSVGSCVFEAMFQRNNESLSSIIHVPDMETYAFRALLRFLYGDYNTPSLSITHDTVMSILYGAKKYCVLGLERLCVDFLKKNISIENALILLSQARLFDEAQLAAQCLEVIDKNAMYALQTPELLDIDLDTLMAILKRDTLGVREVKLWQTCVAWAKNKLSNHQSITSDMIRQTLGGALKLIRFPLMSQEEFAQGPAQSGILTDKEIISIFLYFNLPSKSYKLCDFDDEPRSTFKEYIVNRFREGEVEHRWSYSDAFDRIRFKCDRRLLIAGYGLYGSIREPFEYNVHIQLHHLDSGRILGENETTFMADGSSATFRVSFKEPLEIQQGEYYVASAKLKGPDSFYGINGLRRITHDCGLDGKVTFHFAYASGENNGSNVDDGQIPEIIFCL